MVCVLLNKNDKPGRWLARSLVQAGAPPLQLISAEELLYAPVFSCGFRNGQAFFSVQLHNGFLFSNTTVTAVLNRISYLPQAHLQQFKEEDRSYVQAEQQAIFTFLFSILPGQVFNAASGRGLSGANRSPAEWLLLASEAGLSVVTTTYSGGTVYFSRQDEQANEITVVVFVGRCYSRSPCLTPALAEKLVALQKQSGENILEVSLLWQNNTAFFRSASVQPGFADVDATFLIDLKNRL